MDEVEPSLKDTLLFLQNEYKELEDALRILEKNRLNERDKKKEMTSENNIERNSCYQVFNNNGVIKNMESLREKKVCIIGCNGNGASICEVLVRCGIKELGLVDRSLVEEKDTSCLFYLPFMVGTNKVECLQYCLQEISPDTTIHPFAFDISEIDNINIIKDLLINGSYNLVICCLDNFSALKVVHEMCFEIDMQLSVLVDDENAFSKRVFHVKPSKSPCLYCYNTFDSIVKNSKSKDASFSIAFQAPLQSIFAGLFSTTIIFELLNVNILQSLFVSYYSFDMDGFSIRITCKNLDSSCQNKLCSTHRLENKSTKILTRRRSSVDMNRIRRSSVNNIISSSSISNNIEKSGSP